MANKHHRSQGIYYTKRILTSKAYQELNGTQIKLLNAFWLRRVLYDKSYIQRMRAQSDSAAIVSNNGEIILRYSDIKKECCVTSNETVTRAIDKLIDVGFLDVSFQGGNSQTSKYAICDRWMKYGTSDFKEIHRERVPNQRIGQNTRFTHAIK